MTDDPKHLLSGYAAEILTDDERRRLMEAALDDQETFDRLVEEESWRRVLGAPGVRRELLAALDEPGPLAAFWRWLRQPAVTLAAGSVAAVLLAVVLLPYWTGLGAVDPGAGDPPAATERPEEPELVAKGLERGDLTAKSAGLLNLSYGLELRQGEGIRAVAEDYRFASGNRFRIRIETDFEAWIYLFNRTAGDDDWAVVYPLSAPEHAARRGEILLPPGDGEWLAMDETPGDEELVLVIATESSPALASGRDSIAAAELAAELDRLEAELDSVGWRRFVAADRVHLEVADSRLTWVARLLGGR